MHSRTKPFSENRPDSPVPLDQAVVRLLAAQHTILDFSRFAPIIPPKARNRPVVVIGSSR